MRTRQAGLDVFPPLLERLVAYYEMLTRWNDTINLTGMELRDAADPTLDRIIVEPLLAASLVRQPIKTMVDVGSGGGSPAIPMALALGAELRMVESRTRKAVFLREASRAVGLRNVQVLARRFESVCSDASLVQAHDLATIRAVRLNDTTVKCLRHMVRAGGQVAMFQPELAPRVVGGPLQEVPLVNTSVLVLLDV